MANWKVITDHENYVLHYYGKNYFTHTIDKKMGCIQGCELSHQLFNQLSNAIVTDLQYIYYYFLGGSGSAL